MCGIAGIVTVGPGADAIAAHVAVMQRALAHRGPDGAGRWTSPGREATFANTRLAIIDTSPEAAQPMSIDNGRLTLTFNGEIYNFAELRRELESRGARFHTRSDSEVVLRAYDAYGEECVERFRGMFAFALWDNRNRRLTLARDRFGIKPLYYSLQHDKLIFASEVRAMAASGLVAPAIDARAAYEYFRAGSVPEPRTLLASVRSLEASHIASWQHGRFAQRRYWDLQFQTSIARPDAARQLRRALADSVAQHLVSDVPVGIFLSGGVDSTALLALAHAAGRRDVHALTMALPGAGADESALARRTAAHFGVSHDRCDIDAASARSLFADYFRDMDQPSIDGLNTLAVSRLARDRGLKVVLSGLGADELFGGYKTLRSIPRLHRWHRVMAATGPLAQRVGAALETSRSHRARRIGDLLQTPPSLDQAYAAYRGIFTRAEAHRLTNDFLGTTPERDDIADAVDDALPDATSRLELTRYLKNQLLRDADTMGMAHGVEIRVPYIDGVVVETAARIDYRYRLRAGKRLLREAVPEIPSWIASQPKRGFMFPIDDWLEGDWRDVFASVEQRIAIPTGPWYRRWCVRAFIEFVETNRRATACASGAPVMSSSVIG